MDLIILGYFSQDQWVTDLDLSGRKVTQAQAFVNV